MQHPQFARLRMAGCPQLPVVAVVNILVLAENESGDRLPN
jgi:hypothetical protein